MSQVDGERTLWVMSDRMPVFLIANSIDFNNDVNFRIYSAPVADLIRGTVCDVDGYNQVRNNRTVSVSILSRSQETVREYPKS